MAETMELLPCPFCGGEASLGLIRDGARANCNKCHSSGAPRFNPDHHAKAAAAWNTRATTPMVGEELAAVDYLADLSRMCAGLEAVAAQVQSWIEWSRQHRAAANLETNGDTAIMTLPSRVWPNHAQFEAWIKLFDDVRAILSRLPATGGGLSNDDKHYLGAIKLRLENLYELLEEPRVREQISDEVSWIEEKMGSAP